MLHKIFVILECFHHEKPGGEQQREQQIPHGGFGFAFLRGMHGQGHRPTAREQNRGVQRAKQQIGLLAAGRKTVEIKTTIDDVSHEQPAKE